MARGPRSVPPGSFRLAADHEVEDRPDELEADDDDAPKQLAVSADASFRSDEVAQSEHDQCDLEDHDRQDQKQDRRLAHEPSVSPSGCPRHERLSRYADLHGPTSGG